MMTQFLCMHYIVRILCFRAVDYIFLEPCAFSHQATTAFYIAVNVGESSVAKISV